MLDTTCAERDTKTLVKVMRDREERATAEVGDIPVEAMKLIEISFILRSCKMHGREWLVVVKPRPP